MVFSSSLFLFLFFPVFFLLYLLLPHRFKDAIIIVARLLFYAWGAGYFVIIIVGTTIIDWMFGKLIYEGKSKKLFVTIDVLMNIGLLLWFKYFNFFADNINVVLQAFGLESYTYTKVIMPLGISFVILQKATYCLDISMGKAEPEKNFFYLLEYTLLFPTVIMGPIIQYSELALQFRNRKVTWVKFNYGFQRFAIWKRWHISLTDWFRTYLYTPIALDFARKKPKKVLQII